VATQIAKLIGGTKLQAALNRMVARVGGGSVVKVGFLEGATYPAAAQKRLASNARINKRVRAKLAASAASNGTPLSVAQVAFWQNFGTIRTPARPFFSNMIKQQSPTWGPKLAEAMKRTNLDTQRSLGLLGTNIKDELVRSIVETNSPPNAPSTVARKGFDDPLIDTGTMQRAPDFVVEAGSGA
jgi:hypothetical protein